jgi:hypothetical protein
VLSLVSGKEPPFSGDVGAIFGPADDRRITRVHERAGAFHRNCFNGRDGPRPYRLTSFSRRLHEIPCKPSPSLQ